MSAQQKIAKKIRNARQSVLVAVEEFVHSKGLFRGERLQAVFVSPTMLRYADPFAGVHLFLISEEPNGFFTRAYFTTTPNDFYAADSIETLNREVLEHLEAKGLSIG